MYASWPLRFVPLVPHKSYRTKEPHVLRGTKFVDGIPKLFDVLSCLPLQSAIHHPVFISIAVRCYPWGAGVGACFCMALERLSLCCFSATCFIFRRIRCHPVLDAVSLVQIVWMCDLHSCRALTADDDGASGCRMDYFGRPMKTSWRA